MPKQVQFTKEIIINAAIEILRSEGIDSLTARSLSKKLGCSVAPLFHKYANMEELTADVRKAAGKIVSGYLADAVNYEPAFKEFGLRLVRFSKDEPNLFRYLFLDNNWSAEYADAIAKECLAQTKSNFEVTEDQALFIYAQIWPFVCGLAQLCCKTPEIYTDECISKMLSTQFQSLMALVKSGREVLNIEPHLIHDGERMKNNYNIRLERESDYRIVENLTREAFWNVYQPGCTEHYVLHCYRSNPDFIPELDFVMELDGEIIGHVMFSRAEIIADKGRHIPIVTFGPISIAPAFKRQGYGIALLRFSLYRAKEMGFGAVFMEGNIDFYKHAGFVLASKLHIHYHAEPRESDVPYFLGLELKDGYLDGIEGTYHTPKGYYVAFENPDAFSSYESTFPPKEKLVLPGQLPTK